MITIKLKRWSQKYQFAVYHLQHLVRISRIQNVPPNNQNFDIIILFSIEWTYSQT